VVGGGSYVMGHVFIFYVICLFFAKGNCNDLKLKGKSLGKEQLSQVGFKTIHIH